MANSPLTPEEKRVIIDRGTEAPFSGKYDGFWVAGTYVCRQCEAPLYSSNSKFHSGCGWPSFDQEIPGAVRHQLDERNGEEEAVCAQCGAHLGHVFSGEGFTDTNTRHCINSVSLRFIPAAPKDHNA